MKGLLAFALLSAVSGQVAAETAQPQLVVRIETTAGTMRAVLEPQAAPVTVCNFLRYMRGGHFDGGSFFRTVRSDLAGPNPVPIDVIQMQAREGLEFDSFGPIPLERTSRTGLEHVTGALSMARSKPDTAASSWSIVVRPSPELDYGGRRNPDGQGFAVFGRVIAGMDVARVIHQSPANKEKLRRPVVISRITAEPQSSKMLATVLSHCSTGG